MKLRMTRTTLVCLGFLAVGGYFLIAEHWAHLSPFLPYLILLACPLLHIFMHHGHGHGHDNKSDSSRQAEQDDVNAPLPKKEPSPKNETPNAARVPMTGGRNG